MRVVVTGQVGMDKKHYLQEVVRLAADRGENVSLYNVGDRMYAEAPDVRPGRILDLPLSRLTALRRAVFKDIIADAAGREHVIVNTHATFRWRHGLFGAFDLDQIRALAPDLMVCLVDNVEVVHHRLHAEHIIDATLKDLMVWREEEIMATEIVAQSLGRGGNFFILARGRAAATTESCFRLVCRPRMRKVYPSFPMTHVASMPDVLAQIDAFRAELARRFIAFDPGDVDEKLLLDAALAAAKDGRDFIDSTGSGGTGNGAESEDTKPTFSRGSESAENRVPDGNTVPDGNRATSFPVSVKQVLDIAGDVDGQIYARDFKLIDQSDMIVSLVPELPGGVPGLSSGVERELQHAFEGGKEVYVIWLPHRAPSPFITETATKVFPSTAAALAYFESKGFFHPEGLFGH